MTGLVAKPLVGGLMSAGVLRASKLAEPANESSYFTFNGVDQYVTIPAFSTVGNFSKYRTISVSPAEELADIVDVTQNPLVEFGRVGSNYYSGVIKGIRVIDSSPLLGSTVMAGNDSVYAQLDNAVVVPANTSFSIKMDIIWKDGGGAGAMRLLGKSSGVSGADRIEVYESGNANWGNIQLIQGGTPRTLVGVFDNVTEGQSFEFEVEKVQAGSTQTINCYIDGDLVGTPLVVSTTAGFAFDLLYSSDESNGNKVRAGTAVANLSVSHGASVYSWDLTEGSGFDVTNSNVDTGSDYNGAWVGVLNWEAIPPGANIYLPFNDGSGNIVKNALDASRYSDGLIQNYDSLGGGWSTPETGLTFIRELLLQLDNINDNAGVWDFEVAGDLMYIAAGTDGIYVVNWKTGQHLSSTRMRDDLGVVTSKGTTAVYLYGGNLYAAARSIDWDFDNETGLLGKFDITTDPESPSWTATYNPPNLVRWLNPETNQYANNWFQGIDMPDPGAPLDGMLVLASQRYGVTVVDPSTMTEIGQHTDRQLKILFAESTGSHVGANGSANLVVPPGTWTPGELVDKRVTNTTTDQHMVVTSNTDDTAVGVIWTEGALSWDAGDEYCVNEKAFYYENSRVAHSGNWFFFASHARVVGLDFTLIGSQPLTASDVVIYDAPVLGTQMRIRDVFVSEDGNTLYASPNTNVEGLDYNRGLMSIDITEPKAVDGDDWAIVPFGAAGNFGPEGWNHTGDKGILSLYLLRNQYAFLATEVKGIACYGISTNPPTLIGQRGDVLPPNTHMKAVYAWSDGGNDYVCYSDGNGAVPRNHNFFVDRIVKMGSTEYVIGLAPEGAPSASGIITQASSFEYSSAMERPIVIPEDVEVYEVGAVCASSSSANRSLKVGLFNAVVSGNPLYYHPTTQVQDGGSPVEHILTIDNGTTEQEYSDAASFSIPAGTYMLKIISSGNVAMQNNFNDSGYHRFRQSAAAWPDLGDPTVEPATNESGGDIVVWMKARS